MSLIRVIAKQIEPSWWKLEDGQWKNNGSIPRDRAGWNGKGRWTAKPPLPSLLRVPTGRDLLMQLLNHSYLGTWRDLQYPKRWRVKQKVITSLHHKWLGYLAYEMHHMLRNTWIESRTKLEEMAIMERRKLVVGRLVKICKIGSGRPSCLSYRSLM